MTEDLVELIDEGFETSALSPRHKLAIAYADVLIADPRSLTDEMRRQLAAEFTPPNRYNIPLPNPDQMG